MFNAYFDRFAKYELPGNKADNITHALKIDDKFIYYFNHSDPDTSISDVFPGIMEQLDLTLYQGFKKEDSLAMLSAHTLLFYLYEFNWLNPLSRILHFESHPEISLVRNKIEKAFLDYEKSHAVSDMPNQSILNSPERLIEWMSIYAQDLTEDDERLSQFLEKHATLDQFVFFVKADSHANYRFFDIISLSQLHLSETVKAELSRHFWDECGSGNPFHAHTVLYTKMLKEMKIDSVPHVPVWNDWRPYAGFNLYFLLGFNRRHLFKSLGSLAMPELFEPKLDKAIDLGLKRLGFGSDSNFYHTHVGDNAEPDEVWLKNIVKPIMDAEINSGVEFALGAIFRMNAMRRYNQYLLSQFSIQKQQLMEL